jgi:hypothetical protein
VQTRAALYHELGVEKGERIALMPYFGRVLCIARFGAFHPGALAVDMHVLETAKAVSPIVDRISPRALITLPWKRRPKKSSIDVQR